MGLHAVKILGINITISSKKEILKYIEKSLNTRVIITTPNPEQIVYAQGDKRFADMLNQADVALPDGIGVARMAHVERIAGVEFMEDLVGLAAKRGVPIALIGGRNDMAVKTFECLSKKYLGLKGWAIEPEQIEMEELVKKIQKTGVKMVFVGLGAPKQEFFIEKLRAPCILMSVGGSFDIITGRTPRAPTFLQSIGLEWLWRLIREPRRLGRQLALVKFVWLIVRERVIKK